MLSCVEIEGMIVDGLFKLDELSILKIQGGYELEVKIRDENYYGDEADNTYRVYVELKNIEKVLAEYLLSKTKLLNPLKNKDRSRFDVDNLFYNCVIKVPGGVVGIVNEIKYWVAAWYNEKDNRIYVSKMSEEIWGAWIRCNHMELKILQDYTKFSMKLLIMDTYFMCKFTFKDWERKTYLSVKINVPNEYELLDIARDMGYTLTELRIIRRTYDIYNDAICFHKDLPNWFWLFIIRVRLMAAVESIMSQRERDIYEGGGGEPEFLPNGNYIFRLYESDDENFVYDNLNCFSCIL